MKTPGVERPSVMEASFESTSPAQVEQVVWVAQVVRVAQAELLRRPDAPRLLISSRVLIP